MGFGRLISVSHRHGDPKAALYVVAEADPSKAIEIIKLAIGGSEVEFEDLGHVTDTLLSVLSLQPGQFTRT
jgi:hypothetical protein